MDIRYQISCMLLENAGDRRDKDPEYLNLCQLESKLLEDLGRKGGTDLTEKLADVQGDLECIRLYWAFQYGLRLGVDLFLCEPLHL